MKITLLDNGLDSLNKGFNFMKKYEGEFYIKRELTQNKRFYLLKDAIIYLQHGIEIMMKFILLKENELLLFSEINRNVEVGIKEKREKKLKSIFMTSQSDNLHTVSFRKSLDRIENICGIVIAKELKDKLLNLERLRNKLMHSEINSSEEIIESLFDDFMYQLDMLFIKAIGKEYKSIVGYDEFKKQVKKSKGKSDKSIFKLKFTKKLIEIGDELGISFGHKSALRITNIDKAVRFLNKLLEVGYYFGANTYALHSTGAIKEIRRVDKKRVLIYSQDNNCFYLTSFKSLIIYIPEINDSNSPMIYYECSNDKVDTSLKKFVEKGYEGKYYFLREREILGEDKKIYGLDDYSDWYEKFGSQGEVEYKETFHYLTEGIFCYLNIQGMDYYSGKYLFNKIQGYSGKELLAGFNYNK